MGAAFGSGLDKVTSVGGTLQFQEDGTVKRRSVGREKGTLFAAEIRMTRDEYVEACRLMGRMLPPVQTTFNGKLLERTDSIARFEAKLPAEIADTDGMLRRTVRMATVEVYHDESGPGEILEMGVPVVETDNGYRVNVLQKIPLNMDRDNVTPAFLRAVQAALLNHVYDDLDAEAAAQPWAQEAAGDARATTEAVKAVIKARFGELAVIATPGDPVANANAEAAGFTVVPGGALSADLWANVRKGEVLLPSAKVFPTPRPAALAQKNEAAQVCPTCNRPL